MENSSCLVSIRPVCECGYVFTDLSCKILGFSIMSKPIFSFNPSICPNCNKPISSVHATGYEDEDHNVILISSQEDVK